MQEPKVGETWKNKDGMIVTVTRVDSGNMAVHWTDKHGNSAHSDLFDWCVWNLWEKVPTPHESPRKCQAIGPHHGDKCNGGRIQSPNAQFTRDCRECNGTGFEQVKVSVKLLKDVTHFLSLCQSNVVYLPTVRRIGELIDEILEIIQDHENPPPKFD